MRLLYCARENWEESYIRERLPGFDIVFHQGPLTEAPADPAAEAISLFVHAKLGAAELDRFPNLKFIATRSTGFDHIDLAEAARRGIVVSTVPAYGENTVAEFAFALILALSRRAADAKRRIVETDVFSAEGVRGFDLAGKTLGVVGCGRIGAHAIRIGRGFGMKVLGFDPVRNDALAGELGFTYAALPELFAESDIITLHTPGGEQTHHMVNEELLAGVKQGAYLINTSRGAVVDTPALIKALQSGKLAGAGLDVLEEEGDLIDETKLLGGEHLDAQKLKMALENHYLMNHPSVIVTPHIAYNTKEAVERIANTTIENLKAYAAGAPQNVVAAR